LHELLDSRVERFGPGLVGLLFCATILGLPIGLTLIAAGFKAL
jgi:hypothetical protein